MILIKVRYALIDIELNYAFKIFESANLFESNCEVWPSKYHLNFRVECRALTSKEF